MIWRYPYFRKPANLSSYPCYPDGIDGIYGSIKPSIQMQIFAASLASCSPGFTELTGYSARGSVGCFWYWFCLEMRPSAPENCKLSLGKCGFTVIASRYRSFPSCIPKCIFPYMWNRNIYGELHSNIYIIYMYVMFSHSWENGPQMHFFVIFGWMGWKRNPLLSAAQVQEIVGRNCRFLLNGVPSNLIDVGDSDPKFRLRMMWHHTLDFIWTYLYNSLYIYSTS